MDINISAKEQIESLEAELAEAQAEITVLEERLCDAEVEAVELANQLQLALGQIIIMKSDCNYESPILQ